MNDERANILIVDDMPDKRLSYRTVLEDLGQILHEASSGEAALGLILRHEFAVILLDVNMPGLNGLEVASLLRQRKRTAHTPIIFLTAFADEVQAADGYAHGAVDYILTPVVPEVLRAKVRVFVDLHLMTRRARRQAEEEISLAEERSRRTAAEEYGRQHHFLADVSRALADSLDPDTVARTLVRQAVPYLADYASVTLAGDPGPTEKAWKMPGESVINTRRLPNTPGARTLFADLLDRVFAQPAPELLENAELPFPEHDSARLTTAVALPLRARGRTLGVLVLAHGPSGRTFDPTNLPLTEDFASRAAIALDNARLYHELQLADRQKNNFLAMLAHELRNPLAPIRNAVELLRTQDAGRIAAARDLIARQVTHLVRLVDDLLDVSRITRGTVQLRRDTVSLSEILEQSLEASRTNVERGRHRVEVQLPSEPVFVHGDSTRLAQVFINLVNNATKYSKDEGLIRIRLALQGEEAIVSVHDNGLGIPKDMLHRIFELFTQVDPGMDRSHGGLGIGLTLVKQLVELHGGSVIARSDGRGHGSEFVVRLPVVAPPVASVVTSTNLISAGKRSVLIVDDNVDGAESLAMLLQIAGHDVKIAHNGPDALVAVESHVPDLALLDIGLPGMDGYTLARKLRDRPDTRRIVLVALTGYGREEDRSRSREAGLDHHFVKPIALDDLQGILAATKS